MPDKSNNPFKFWEELKRRKVVRVVPVYAAASFVLLELVDIIASKLLKFSIQGARRQMSYNIRI